MPSAVTYQFSMRTQRQPEEVLSELGLRGIHGVGVLETGPSYLVLGSKYRRHYGPVQATLLVAALVLTILIATAVYVWLVALLPIAAVPLVPLLLDRNPMVAVSATPDEDGVTRVTAHGEASPETAAALDAYFSALPVANAPEAQPADTGSTV